MLRLLIVCALLLGACDYAVAELARVRDRGVLQVGIKNDRPGSPEGHKDPAHLRKRDFEIELARAFAEHLFGTPDKVAFSSRRKPERLAAVATGEVDLGIAMHRVVEGGGAVT